jgi:hypothetical protein
MIDISAYMKATEIIGKLLHDGKIKKEEVDEKFIQTVLDKVKKGIDVEAEYNKKKKRFWFF